LPCSRPTAGAWRRPATTARSARTWRRGPTPTPPEGAPRLGHSAWPCPRTGRLPPRAATGVVHLWDGGRKSAGTLYPRAGCNPPPGLFSATGGRWPATPRGAPSLLDPDPLKVRPPSSANRRAIRGLQPRLPAACLGTGPLGDILLCEVASPTHLFDAARTHEGTFFWPYFPPRTVRNWRPPATTQAALVGRAPRPGFALSSRRRTHRIWCVTWSSYGKRLASGRGGAVQALRTWPDSRPQTVSGQAEGVWCGFSPVRGPP